MKRIVILGSTGSIGANALDVIKRNPDKFKLVGLSANNNFNLLARQAKQFNVKKIAIANERLYRKLKQVSSARVFSGIEGVSHLAGLQEADLVLLAIGGTSSIIPLVSAINAGKDIAIASKESLVSAGEIVNSLIEKNKVSLIPVDSEHSAIFQCLEGNRKFLKRIYLTGTGGSLRTVKKSFFDRLPMKAIMNHPKWKMGKKITVDSATLMNKGLEIIEAKHLFGVKPEDIQVVLHPEAIIHSMVEFSDSSILANLFCPDMRIPISYALSFPERVETKFPRVDFFKIKKFTFEKPSFDKFPALRLCYEALKNGQSAQAVLNAANEEAVGLYLGGSIKFTKITNLVEKVLKLHTAVKNPGIKDILKLDEWAKEEVRRLC